MKSLNDFLATSKPEFSAALKVAVGLCRQLCEAERSDTFYEHLSPAVITVDDDLQIGIVAPSTDTPAGMLSYAAPEQLLLGSGSVNASTVVYTAGIILYEVFAGQKPYAFGDDIEYAHTIVSKKVPLLHEVDTTIPTVLSRIIDKMAAVDQTERYGDMLSALADMAKVWHVYQEHGRIDDFELDRYGLLTGTRESHVLYGREAELARIQYQLDAKKDRSNMVLSVKGPSGAGKSTMVSRIIDTNSAFFSHVCSFKLESGEQNTPYQMLFAELRRMVRQIIASDDDVLRAYCKRLDDVVGNVAPLLCQAIPELETLLAYSEAEANGAALDTQTGLDTLLVRFFEIFSDPKRPVCIYIDDMQWADSVIAGWLKGVLIEQSNIVVFLTYRDDAVTLGDAPVLRRLLHELESYGLNIHTFMAEPLSAASISKLLFDAVALQDSGEIARIIYDRTKGNPFFVMQYLKQLQRDEGIWFDTQRLVWRFDLQKIEALQVSENVFDILSAGMHRLSAEVRHLLCVAACMGNLFQKELLRKVYAYEETFETSLAQAIAQGWIVKERTHADTPESYRFLHDKMQEAIGMFLRGKMADKLHYRIGCQLERGRREQDYHDLILCVNHLNLGAQYVRDKVFLGRLNLKASYNAKLSGDFASALGYIHKAMELFFAEASEAEIFQMLKQRAECEHLCNNSSEAIVYYERALESTVDIRQQGEVYELMIKLYSDISNFTQAYAVGRVATRALGVEIPKSFVPPKFVADFVRLKLKLRGVKPETLTDLPSSDDEVFKILIRIMANTLQAAYQIRPELSVANAMQIVSLCLEKGLTREAVIGFTVFGVIFQGAILGNHKVGFDYSRLSFAMLERFNNTTQHAEVRFVCGYFGTSWLQSAVETETLWNTAYKNGLEIGDWFHTGCAAAGIVQSMLMRGVSLEEVREKIAGLEPVLLGIGALEQLGAMRSVKQMVLNLTGETESTFSFDTHTFDEQAYKGQLETYASKHFALYYFVNKMTVLYLRKAYGEAEKTAQEAAKYVKSAKGMLHHAEYQFYHALIGSQMMDQRDFPARRSLKSRLLRTRNRFVRWAKACEENFLVRARLLQAEVLRHEGDTAGAVRRYEQAADLASIYGQHHLSGIALRLCGALLLQSGQKRAARTYEQEARKHFQQWGFYQEDASEPVMLQRGYYDVNTLIASSEAIAQERDFHALLKKLMRTVNQIAGAQQGVLLLERDGSLLIEALASADADDVDVMHSLDYRHCKSVVHSVIAYAVRTNETVVIDDMSADDLFSVSNLESRKVRSVCCAPLMLQGKLKGLIYLENNLLPDVFTEEKVKLLQALSGQIVIAIENAIVYRDLESKIEERTKDLKATQEELKRLAATDPLTRLYNRRHFSEIAAPINDLSKRDGKALSLMMIDIDHFKRINDNYGHKTGDAAIVSMSDILRNQTRQSDITCRFGGEEFLVLLPDTGLDGALQIAQKIRQTTEARVLEVEAMKLSFTVSIGVAPVSLEQEAVIETAISNADQALYRAKNEGRNRVCAYGV